MKFPRPIPSIRPMVPLLLIVSLAVQSHGVTGKELLFLDFNDSAALGLQPAPLPAGAVYGDATASKDFPGSVDLGSQGNVGVTPFRGPRGPFSVEARFRLRSYAPLATRYISDILNTATWASDFTQGFVLRIGGGYLYSPLPRENYATEADYQASLGWYVDSDRAFFSRCIGEFAVGATGDPVGWKEVVTDRCIELNAWAHLVGTWDGSRMRIYLNGHEATDSWRVLGADRPAHIDSEALATVGARDQEDYDSRHSDGIVDFVRIVDSAMSKEEINRRYIASFVQEVNPKPCTGTILPINPKAGECAKQDADFRFEVVANPGCAELAKEPYRSGDTVEVEFAKEPTFENIFLKMDVTDTAFHIDGNKLAEADAHFAGDTYWRARLKHVHDLALAKASALAPSGEWSSPRPIILDMRQDLASVLSSPRRTHAIFLNPGAGTFFPDDGSGRVPELFTLKGDRLEVRFRRSNGGWRLARDSALPIGLVLRQLR